ncbi:MAG: hypothetical protein AAGF95_16910 [Chloroflexota bacterium]
MLQPLGDEIVRARHPLEGVPDAQADGVLHGDGRIPAWQRDHHDSIMWIAPHTDRPGGDPMPNQRRFATP